MSNDENKAASEDSDMNDAESTKREATTGENDKASSGDDDDDDDDKMKDGKAEETEEKQKKDERTEEEKEAARKKYENWPLKHIKEPHENDVMYGRGGGTNHHPGNKRYRKMVEDRKLDYVNSKRLDKPLVALDIIRVWRAQEPPGRFLKLDEKTGLWHDVGDKKAREKTSQALREKAPLIRKQQEEEKTGEDGSDEKDHKGEKKEGEAKVTRFAEGTKTESSKTVKKAVLARDHSLGREYLQAGESVSLEGFSWQDPFQAKKGPPPPPGGPPQIQTSASYPPAGRNSSHGSLGMPPPHHQTSIGGPPPPPDYYGRTTSDDRHRQYSNGRFDSWGSPAPYPYPPPGGSPVAHQRSGSWSKMTPPPPVPHGASHHRSGSWTNTGREHSLSHNPLANASVSQPASQSAFDSSRSASGQYWGEPLHPTAGTSIPPPPPPPPGPYGSTGPYGSPGPYRSPRQSLTPPKTKTSSPPHPYSVDMSIAKTWSGGGPGELKTSWSGDGTGRPWSRDYDNRQNMPAQPGSVPRPEIVKRDTSHQNETYETKPSIKRAALNRDNSLASNRLKEQYMPEFYNGRFDTEREMKILSDNLEQSTLNSAMKPKPKALSSTERESTLDAIAMDLMVKPAPLLEGNRTSTIDALDLDLDDDPILKPSEMKRELSMEEEIQDLKKGVPKPSAMNMNSRLTTVEFMEMINEPIGEDKPLVKTANTSAERPIDITKEPSITQDWLANNA